MQDLPDVGARLVLEGTSQFVSDLNSANQRLNEFRQTVSNVATAASNQSAINQLRESIATIGAGTRATSADIAALHKNISELPESSYGAARALREQNQATADAAAKTELYNQQAQKMFAANTQITGSALNANASQRQLAAGFGANVVALNQQNKAQDDGVLSSLNYYRAITSIHSVNNLLGVSSLNTASNIATLGLSFSQAGQGGILFGAGLGIAAAGVGAIAQGVQQVVGFVESVAVTAAKAGVAVAAVIGTAAVEATKFAADYEQQMAFIAALTGATQEQLVALNGTIEALVVRGQSIPQIADGITELAKAGVPLETIMSGAARAVVDFAVASNGELGAKQAAEALAVGINVFGKQGVDATHIVNALTGAAQLSKLSFTEVSQAFQQASPAARTLKIPIEDLATAIAILGNNGLKGSVAGTSLKQVLLDLEKPSKNAAAELDKAGVSLYNIDGTIRPLPQLFADMNRAFGEQAVEAGKVTDAERTHALAVIFGSRAGLAANIITNEGVAAFQAMRTAIEDVNATDMANIMLLPLNARMEILKNSVGVLANNFGQMLLPALSDVTNKGIEFVRSIDVNMLQTVGQAVVALATGQGFGLLVERISALTDNEDLANFFIEVANTGRILRDVISEIGEAAATAWGILFGEADFGSLASGVEDFGIALAVVGQAISDVIVGVATLVENILSNNEAMLILQNVAIGLAEVIGIGLVTAFVAIAVPIGIAISLMAVMGAASRQLVGAVAAAGEAIGFIWENIGNIIGTVVRWIISQALNALTFGFAESFEDVGNSAALFVGYLGQTLKQAGEPFAGLADAISHLPEGFSNAFGGAGRVVAAFINWAGEQIGRFLSWLSSLPIFGEAIGTAAGFAAGFAVGGPVFAGFAASVAPAIRAAFAGITAEVGKLQIASQGVQTRFSDLGGTLTGMFDNIRSAAARARDAIDQTGGAAERAAGAPYGGGGGGGGKGGKGGGGGRAGAEKKTALEGFLDEMANDAIKYREELGKLGGDLAADLTDAIRDGTEASGKKVATALNKLIEEMVKVGVEGTDQFKQNLQAGLVEAFSSGNIAPAIDAIQEAVAALTDATSFSSQFAKLGEKALASNELSEALGEAGSKAFEALVQGFDMAGPEAAKGLNSALQKVRDDMKKANLPGWRQAWDELWQLALQATQTGGDEEVAAFHDKLQAINAEIEKAKPTAKTAIQGFWKAVSDVAKDDDSLAKFGEAGAKAVALMTAEFENEADRVASGGQIGNAVQKLIQDAQKAGVPNAAATGQELMRVVAAAIVEGTPEAQKAAQDAIASLFDATQVAKSTQKIQDVVDKALKDIKLKLSPKEGGGLTIAFMDAAAAAVAEQTPKNVDTMFDFAQKMVSAFEHNLSPEKAYATITEFMRLLNAAVVEHTPESLAALQTFVDQQAAVFAGSGTDKIGDAIEKMWTDLRRKTQPLIDVFFDTAHKAFVDGNEAAQKEILDMSKNILDIMQKKLTPEQSKIWGDKFMTALQLAFQVGGEEGLRIIMQFITDANTQLNLGLQTAQNVADQINRLVGNTAPPSGGAPEGFHGANTPGGYDWLGNKLPGFQQSNKAYPANTSHGGTLSYAAGGWLNEPIAGIGMHSMRQYNLAEAGPEHIGPMTNDTNTGWYKAATEVSNAIAYNINDTLTEQNNNLTRLIDSIDNSTSAIVNEIRTLSGTTSTGFDTLNETIQKVSTPIVSPATQTITQVVTQELPAIIEKHVATMEDIVAWATMQLNSIKSSFPNTPLTVDQIVDSLIGSNHTGTAYLEDLFGTVSGIGTPGVKFTSDISQAPSQKEPLNIEGLTARQTLEQYSELQKKFVDASGLITYDMYQKYQNDPRYDFMNHKYLGDSNAISYASGGWLTEPVSGIGLRSMRRYNFAEAGTEYISSNGDLSAQLRQVAVGLTAIARREFDGGRGSAPVVHNNTYVVNANYASIQSHASVRQDMRALVAISGK